MVLPLNYVSVLASRSNHASAQARKHACTHAPTNGIAASKRNHHPIHTTQTPPSTVVLLVSGGCQSKERSNAPSSKAACTLCTAPASSRGRLTARRGIALPSLSFTSGTVAFGSVVTLMTAVPTLPSPPPKNKRIRSLSGSSTSCSAAGSSVAEHAKITFLRSPVYLHVGEPVDGGKSGVGGDGGAKQQGGARAEDVSYDLVRVRCHGCVRKYTRACVFRTMLAVMGCTYIHTAGGVAWVRVVLGKGAPRTIAKRFVVERGDQHVFLATL